MRVREATVADAPAIARAHAEWRRGYLAGLVPAELDAPTPVTDTAAFWHAHLTDSTAERTVVVAEEDGGRVVGAARGGPLRLDEIHYDGDLGYDSELYYLFVVNLPGIAPETEARRALVRAIATHLWRAGRRSMLAWDLEGGLTCSVYIGLGGVRLDHVEPRLDYGLRYAPYGWPELSALLNDA
jgi:hypothetical protein